MVFASCNNEPNESESTNLKMTDSVSKDISVVLNHFYITVDSSTYQAILNSEILNSDFAFSYENIRNWGGGIYIIGKNNYIEIFHPNSIVDEYIPVGFTWVCQSSLVANGLENIDLPNNDFIEYSSDENFNELSAFTNDSIYVANAASLFTTMEMNKMRYENWTNKTFNDTLHFLTTDYNDPAESDSSLNYLFKNVTGIEIKLNTRDSLNITQYLELIGYRFESKDHNRFRSTNSNDFIELHFSDSEEMATISVIHFELNRSIDSKQILVGNSEIQIEGNSGQWIIEK